MQLSLCIVGVDGVSGEDVTDQHVSVVLNSSSANPPQALLPSHLHKDQTMCQNVKKKIEDYLSSDELKGNVHTCTHRTRGTKE